MVKVITSHGGDIARCDVYGCNALYYCAWNGYLDVLSCLLSLSTADFINQANHYNQTPLYWASGWGNIECIELLLQHDADVNIVANKGLNAFDVACTYDRKHYKEDIQGMLKYDICVASSLLSSCLLTS